jgi:hypothetical protein
MSQPVDDRAAGKIERKAQTESEALLDTANGSPADHGREVIEPAQFVVLTEFAPIRAGRPLPPTPNIRFPIGGTRHD